MNNRKNTRFNFSIEFYHAMVIFKILNKLKYVKKKLLNKYKILGFEIMYLPSTIIY